jgi:hypothetical protein
MNTKRSQSIIFVPVMLTILALVMAACQPQAQPLAGPDPTAVAASVEAYFSETATQPATAAPSPEPVTTDEPKTIDTGSQSNTLLPAPLYFLSMQSGSWQIWRIEMNGGFPRQVTDLPAPVSDFDISPWMEGWPTSAATICTWPPLTAATPRWSLTARMWTPIRDTTPP